jgi:hypothetical protein
MAFVLGLVRHTNVRTILGSRAVADLAHGPALQSMRQGNGKIFAVEHATHKLIAGFLPRRRGAQRIDKLRTSLRPCRVPE